jgi:citrate synthase
MAMSNLKAKLLEKIEAHRPRTTKLNKEFGNVVIDKVNIGQCIGGARDIRSLVTDISYLDPFEGIRFRGKTIPETFAALPKVPGKEQPFVEGFFWFLLTGEVPTMAQTQEVVEDWKSRSAIPAYVIDVLRAMPRDSHPMTMLSAAVLTMQRDSVFAKKYGEGGLKKNDMWDPMYEDSMNLLAKLPPIAAYIYRMKYKSDIHIQPDPKLDWGGNFAHMMGVAPPYDELARMYFILHSDHESGNVSAHTTHLVASALSDAYYSFSAGLNGLAGPLHGLANQEVLGWIQNVMKKLNNKVPTKEELEKFLWDTLNSGQVIPGYGHAVLRKTDPRYVAQNEYSKKHLPNDPMFHQARQDQEPLAERRRALGRHPVVLRRPRVGLLHGPLRRRPRARRARQHHLGPRPRLRHRAPQVGHHRHARAMGQGRRPQGRRGLGFTAQEP